MTGRAATTGSEIAAHGGRGRRLCGLLAPGRALAALVVILASIAIGAPPIATAAPDDRVKVVALLDVQFLNDHADLEPTTKAEQARPGVDRVPFQG